MTEKRTKHYQTTTAEHLVYLTTNLGFSPAALAEKMGINPSTIHKWIGDNRCPVWTVLAAEAIRQQKEPVTDDRVIMIRVPKGKWQVVGAFLGALGIDMIDLLSQASSLKGLSKPQPK
jgi:hypothetical protein